MNIGDIVTLNTTVYDGWDKDNVKVLEKSELVPIVNILCGDIITVKTGTKTITLNYDRTLTVQKSELLYENNQVRIGKTKTVQYELLISSQVNFCMI